MKQSIFNKDLANKKLMITREFDGSLKDVWQAWTEAALLEQWWAPEPYKAKTKTMDFRAGGHWLYCMVGPDHGEHPMWCRADYKKIIPEKSFESIDAFCDENGVPTTDFPRMEWKVSFFPTDTGTRVEVEIVYAKVEDMEKILELGFQEGFTMAHGNLDRLLKKVMA